LQTCEDALHHLYTRMILADMQPLITIVLTGMRFVTVLVLRSNDGEALGRGGGLFRTMNTLLEGVGGGCGDQKAASKTNWHAI